MKVSTRETMLALSTVAAILLAVGIWAIRGRYFIWSDLGDSQKKLVAEIQKYQTEVAKRPKLEAELKELSTQLPEHSMDRKVDVLWLSRMDELASKHGVQINKRLAGEQAAQGDLYELEIECKDWEASLDQIVHFLFELQSEGAMFDIRQLFIKPKGKGVLRGRFSLSCAYTRKETPAPR